MYEFFFPSWRPERKTAWEDEYDLLSKTLDLLPTALETRCEQKQTLEHTRAEILKLEANLNDIVYAVFDLTAQDRKVIERFLERF